MTGDGKYKSVTGFHINLGIDTAYVEGNCETGIILFRYAEGLLCYAEAAAELEGKWNDAVLNKTLKPLRERAGVTWSGRFDALGRSRNIERYERTWQRCLFG